MESLVRRRQIVGAVLELLAEAQIEAVTTRSIARRLEISQPALFRHFRSRDAILAAVLAQVRADLGAVAEGALQAPGGPLAGLGYLVEGLLAYVEANPGVPRLLFGSVVGPRDEVQVGLRAMLALQVGLVSALVQEGQAAGVLAAGEPEALAAGLVGMIQGYILQWEVADRAYPLPARAASLLALWLDGARARAGGAAPVPAPRAAPPAVLRGLVPLDVRPILAAGRDPLEDILAALATVASPGALELTAPFLPRPLLALLARRGLEPQVRVSGGLHLVVVPVAAAIADLSDLESPEPMQRVLEVAEALEPGAFTLARVPRVPRPLLAELAIRNFSCEVLESPDGTALVRVGRPA